VFRDPNRVIFVGFLLVLSGAVLPFLMVIRVLDSSLLLGFIAYSNSVGGLTLGLLGMATVVKERQTRR